MNLSKDVIIEEDQLLKKGFKHLKAYWKDLIEKNKWKLVILTPVRDMVPRMGHALHTMMKPPHLWHLKPSFFIQNARESLVDLVYEKVDTGELDYFTHILFFDSDIVPPFYGLMRLLQRDCDIISGLYCTKKYPIQWHVYEQRWNDKKKRKLMYAMDITPQDRPLDFYDKFRDRVIPVDGTGLGFALIKKRVFDTIPKPWFQLWHPDDLLCRIKQAFTEREYARDKILEITEDVLWNTHTFIGEDLYFFVKAKRYGFQPYIDFSVVCEHMQGNLSFPCILLGCERLSWHIGLSNTR